MSPLDRERTRELYDRFGARQDRQGWYEDPATDDLVAHAEFPGAMAVVELGCGTGRFAETLLERHLGGEATYLGLDSSRTMVELARRRLAPFAPRAAVRLTDGSPRIDLPGASCDRFVSNYVLDLLGEEDIRRTLAEAHRLLVPGGFLCVAGLCPGFDLRTWLVAGLWRVVHALRPSLVGGCRPVALESFLDPARWSIRHRGRVGPYGIPSGIIVAVRGRHREEGRPRRDFVP